MVTYNFNILTRARQWLDTSSPVFTTRMSLVVCMFIAAGAITLGLIEGSLAVRTNGLISAIDILNSFLFITAVNQSVRSPDNLFNYGYGKYESLSILTAALLLSVVLIYTLIEAVSNFGSVDSGGGNYYILLAFSTATFFVMRWIFKVQKSAARRFHMPILNFDAELWRIDSLIELGVLANLILGAVLQALGQYKYAVIIDSVTAIALIGFAMKVPFKGSKEALNQLLDRTLPDSIQFDILAVISENLSRMCEFKQVHTRQSGKDIFIEIDIIMPHDYTLDKMTGLEADLKNALKEKYPTAVPRIYFIPCSKDCVYGGTAKCPVSVDK